ncbi:MAG: tRNA-dihydrouridine synthase family protein [Lentisphaerae bacterium]|nr:tRNA-dihydrouridine synthase family protein [Lentisphaerota bacterium]
MAIEAPSPTPSPTPEALRLPLVAAPMAGLTHSAFRRLVGELGGAAALTSEMLAGTRLLVERPDSPYLRRRPGDGPVIYQLLLRDARRLDEIVDRLRPCHPDGIDLNCACPAGGVRALGGGAALFEDAPRLGGILRELRRLWSGPLSVKIRLGHSPVDGWEQRLRDRLAMLRDHGVDRLTIHPRFAVDRLTRPARPALLPWLCAEAGLPVVANGDIAGPATVAAHPEYYAACSGLMLGRIAVVRPWIFAAWQAGAGWSAPSAAAVWRRAADHIAEDFPAATAARRLRQFTGWYARNFAYGHILAGRVRHLEDLATLRDVAEAFLADDPATVASPPLHDL